MSSGQLSEAQILLIKAAEDEQALHADGNPDAILGFHAQQSVEKLLKALLSQMSVVFEFTHDLGRLRTALEAAGETLPAIPQPLMELNDFAVTYRYDMLYQPKILDKTALIETVRILRKHITARIAALSGQS